MNFLFLRLVSFFAVGVVCFQTGCIEFYLSKQIDVLVRDAETGVPIEGAKLKISYSRSPVFNNPIRSVSINIPENQEATTDGNGRLNILATNYQPGRGIPKREWEISCKGYLTRSSSNESTEGLDPFSIANLASVVPYWYQNGEMDSEGEEGVDAVVELWKCPQARYQVVVPSDYRGPVFVESVNVWRHAAQTDGKRLFRTAINKTGYAKIEVLQMGDSVSNLPYIEFVDENFEEIGRSSLDFDDGKQWEDSETFYSISLENNMRLYFQGSAEEAKAFHSEVENDIDGDSRHHVTKNEQRFLELLQQAKNGDTALLKKVGKKQSAAIYRNHITTILRSKNVKQVDNAYKELRSGGLPAIGQLVDFLDDKRVPELDRSMLSVSKKPTLGTVCYTIVQGMIEEKPTKIGFYNTLYPKNLKQWLIKRKGKNLHDLKVDAARQSLEKATKHWEESNAELAKQNIQFYKKVLKELDAKELDAKELDKKKL